MCDVIKTLDCSCNVTINPEMYIKLIQLLVYRAIAIFMCNTALFISYINASTVMP